MIHLLIGLDRATMRPVMLLFYLIEVPIIAHVILAHVLNGIAVHLIQNQYHFRGQIGVRFEKPIMGIVEFVHLSPYVISQIKQSPG